MNRINNTMYYSKSIHFCSVNITISYTKTTTKNTPQPQLPVLQKQRFFNMENMCLLCCLFSLVYSSAVSWFFFITPYSHHDDHDLLWVGFTHKKRTYNKSVSWLLSFLTLICLVETRKVSGLMRRRRTYVEGKLWKKYAWNVWYYCIAIGSLLFNKHLQQLSKKILLVHCVIFNCIRIRRQDISKRYICFEEMMIMKMLRTTNDFLVRWEREQSNRAMCFFLSIFDAMIPKIRYVDVSQ